MIRVYFMELLVFLMVFAMFGCGADESIDDDSTLEETIAGISVVVSKPKPEFIPVPTGPCPLFVDGQDGCTSDDASLICVFELEGQPERKVRFWFDDSAFDTDSMLVFYWHGWFGNALHAVSERAGMSAEALEELRQSGGILAAPESALGSTTTELPWPNALGTGGMEDFLLMDEVVACVDKVFGLDKSRIHSMGMSAGGLQTGEVGHLRNGYIASTAVFSGGLGGTPELQDPDHKYPTMLFCGGESDEVIINFQVTQTQYKNIMDELGHFAILCDHGQGHSVPRDSAAAAWQFIKDTPLV